MSSPYLIVLLALVVGFFLMIALSLQFWACVRAFRKVQREKARLREIQLAAAESPPPYALVILDRNFPRPPQQPCQCQADGDTCRNVCGVNRTLPSSTSEDENPNFNRSESTSKNPSQGSHGTFCMLCRSHQSNMKPANTILQREMFSPVDADVLYSSTTEKGHVCIIEMESEILPTYEQAIRYSISETTAESLVC